MIYSVLNREGRGLCLYYPDWNMEIGNSSHLLGGPVWTTPNTGSPLASVRPVATVFQATRGARHVDSGLEMATQLLRLPTETTNYAAIA